MGLTAQEILTIAIAVGGFLGTVALMVLNLKVQWAMSELRLEVANMRTDAANDKASLYEKIITAMNNGFVSRGTAEAMHQSNVGRLNKIDEDIRELSQRVTDIS